MRIALIGSLIILSLLFSACSPAATPVPLLSAIPPGTLTALAPTATRVVPTRTPRPTLPPTETPQPLPTATPTELPTLTPTPGPVEIDPLAPHLTPFGAGTVLRFAALQTFDGGLGWAVAEPRLDRDDHVVVTRNGGYQWRDVTPPQPADRELREGWAATFFALNGETAWAVFADRATGNLPEQAWVWRTADAGTTWQTSVALDLGGSVGFRPLDLHFNDAAHGWLLVADAPDRDPTSRRLYATNDGGAHWAPVSAWSSAAGEACATVAARRTSLTEGYLFAECPGALDQQPLLRQTGDGGQTWEPLALPLPKAFPQSFDGRCIATPEWVTAEDLVFRTDCLATETGALAQFLLRAEVDQPDGFRVAGFGQTQLLDAAFFSAGDALLLVDPRPDRVGDLHILRTADTALNTQRQRAVSWLGFIETAGAGQMWAILTSDASALYVSTDGGRTWGRTDAVVVE
ncbi:MAG TPA: hypothetical protein PLC98_04460 [Anaerolineales bacterium]|nr:hypothetical protein [Anaerolineales bacterium]